MIILDTNIISELMKSSPNSNVANWVDAQKSSDLFLSVITVAEVSYGLNALPNGKRRKSLETAFHAMLNEAFEHRVVEFDESAALQYGDLMAHRKSSGRPMSICDGQIAAIALKHHAAVATRNIQDFQDCGFELINPFDYV